MKDNSGKVILALLAGASAGIVAGLLMAPETGSATRETLGKSLGKFGDDLGKLLQDSLGKLDALKGSILPGDADTSTADRQGAESAFSDLTDPDASAERVHGGVGSHPRSGGSGADANPASDSPATSTRSAGRGAATGSASTATGSTTPSAGRAI